MLPCLLPRCDSCPQLHLPVADGLEPIPSASNNVINVRLPPYNAKGDGQSDDTDAIQTALAAAGSAGGGVVYLPAGTYVFRRPVTMRKSGVILRGDGRGKTTIRIPVSLSDVYQGTWVQDPKTGGVTWVVGWGCGVGMGGMGRRVEPGLQLS